MSFCKRLLIALFFLSFYVWAEETDSSCLTLDLSSVKPNKVNVLGGAALAEPVRSDVGYTVPVEGKILYTFDGEGDIVWTHGISSKPDSISVGKGGMFFVVSRKSVLSLVNPSGRELWKVKVGFKIEGKPFSGRDGRVIVRDGGHLACYGIKGIRRWSLEIADQDIALPLVELNDGRIIVFLTQTIDGKSTAVTLSPFGETLEELTFSGLVEYVASCGDGVLLSFADGSIGLCSVQGGKTVSRWVRSGAETAFFGAATIIPSVFNSREAAFISGAPAKLLYVNTLSGKIETEAKTGINSAAIRYKAETCQGLVFADAGHIECYGRDGLPVWKASYSNASACPYLYVSDEGFIVFCGKDWVISSYRVKQNLSAGVSSYKEPGIAQYSALYSTDSASSSELLGRAISPAEAERMRADWKNGDFGVTEKDYLSVLNNEISSMSIAYTTVASGRMAPEYAYFVNNPSYCREVLFSAASSGLWTFAPYVQQMLKNSKDDSLSYTLVKAAGEIAFDSDGALLDALFMTACRTPAGKDATLFAICDSVYEICRFMGRPAFMKKGNEILSFLLFPQFSQRVHEYAKRTLDKIIAAKL